MKTLFLQEFLCAKKLLWDEQLDNRALWQHSGLVFNTYALQHYGPRLDTMRGVCMFLLFICGLPPTFQRLSGKLIGFHLNWFLYVYAGLKIQPDSVNNKTKTVLVLISYMKPQKK